VQAERRKKELVHFLFRGAAYIQPKVKGSASREEKKVTCSFLFRGAAYIQPKVKGNI